MKNLQQAADDAGTIAETVEALGKLLDKFHADHGDKIYARLKRAFPSADQFGGSAPDLLYCLEQQLTDEA